MKTPTQTADAIRARVERGITRELDRCRLKMGDESWRAHGEWVQEFIMTSAKEWLMNEARKGAL